MSEEKVIEFKKKKKPRRVVTVQPRNVITHLGATFKKKEKRDD